MKLSPSRRAELLNELQLRVLFRDKVLCRRYGVSRSTLARLQREALDQMAQNVPKDIHVLWFPTNMTQKAKA
jgi:hypothetical protein